ncbi:single-stranded DNA-binding protein [Klebsiella pneumoniae]|nr:single-stranded DNA-binding protein [Klebsiella pneumoniae]
MTNRLEPSGIICRTPLRKVSPSGIPHRQFVLEHRSVQGGSRFSPAGMVSQMPVIISGHENQAITHSITVGSAVTVRGFISCHKAKETA